MPGGVCAVLDYEVDLMAEYVAEMATRVVMPRSSTNGAFRKFVSQILSSTRLPSTTILLGMNYLAKRMNMMTAAGQTMTSEGQIWRMLTIALLLGSKFLDDNTFQNKSWSDVSGISVQELNTLEYEWLSAINWCLYVNLDASKDYNAWLKNWEAWQENKKRQAHVSRERLASLLTPVDTEPARPRNPHVFSTWHQQQIAEYERLSKLKRNQFTQEHGFGSRDTAWHPYPATWHNAPLTPPDSGYGTPEYPDSAVANSQYNEWFSRAVLTSVNAERHYQQTTPGYSSFRHSSRAHPTYGSYFNHGPNIWEPSIADCNCVKCAGQVQSSQPYFGSHSYGQPVMG